MLVRHDQRLASSSARKRMGITAPTLSRVTVFLVFLYFAECAAGEFNAWLFFSIRNAVLFYVQNHQKLIKQHSYLFSKFINFLNQAKRSIELENVDKSNQSFAFYSFHNKFPNCKMYLWFHKKQRQLYRLSRPDLL